LWISEQRNLWESERTFAIIEHRNYKRNFPGEDLIVKGHGSSEDSIDLEEDTVLYSDSREKR
jgi:hypothetical protein